MTLYLWYFFNLFCSFFCLSLFLYFLLLFLLSVPISEKLKYSRNFLSKSINADLQIRKLMFDFSSIMNSLFIKNLCFVWLFYFLCRTGNRGMHDRLTGLCAIWLILTICTCSIQKSKKELINLIYRSIRVVKFFCN